MEKIGKLWAGKLYGTNTGNLSAEFDTLEDGITGVIRFMDDRFGLVVYNVRGTFDGTIVILEGTPTISPDDIEVATVSATGNLSSEGEIRGQWQTPLGTGGAFILYPHDTAIQNNNKKAIPEQLYVATRHLGAIRLYANDVEEIIQYLAKDFSVGQVIVTYRDRGNETSKYASSFQNDFERIGELRFIRFTIQEPDTYGINKFVSVELNANGRNEIRAQGVQESWVIGKAEATLSLLRTKQKTLSTTLQRYGLNFNALLALGTLIALPELDLRERFLFVSAVLLVSAMVTMLHTRFIPNALIFLSEKKASTFERIWPQILSWVIAASAALAAAIVYGILKGDLLR